jgi:hypothetical protein
MKEFRFVALLISTTGFGALAPVTLCNHVDRSASSGSDAAADSSPSAKS